MRKIRWISVLVCIMMTVFVGVCFAGCDKDEPDETLEVIDPYGEYIKKDFDTKMREELIRPEGMSEEEFNVRISVEAVNMYDEYKDSHYMEHVFNEPRYGIEDFRRYDSLIRFYDLNDMKQVMGNKAFQKDYRNKFGVQSPLSYYLPKHTEDDNALAKLLAVDGECYFSNRTSIYIEEKGFIAFYVFDRQEDIDAQIVANTYAALEGLTPKKAAIGDHDVYYYSDGDCVLFKVLHHLGTEIATAYFWEKDGVLGIIVIRGEHEEKNLEYCELVKYEF